MRLLHPLFCSAVLMLHCSLANLLAVSCKLLLLPLPSLAVNSLIMELHHYDDNETKLLFRLLFELLKISEMYAAIQWFWIGTRLL